MLISFYSFFSIFFPYSKPTKRSCSKFIITTRTILIFIPLYKHLTDTASFKSLSIPRRIIWILFCFKSFTFSLATHNDSPICLNLKIMNFFHVLLIRRSKVTTCWYIFWRGPFVSFVDINGYDMFESSKLNCVLLSLSVNLTRENKEMVFDTSLDYFV